MKQFLKNKNKHNMNKRILLNFCLVGLVLMAFGCKNKKPNASVESNTVEAIPPPIPHVNNASTENTISLVDGDSLAKSKQKTDLMANKPEKPMAKEKPKKIEAKPTKTDKTKGATAGTKIPAPSKTAPATNGAPAKGKPMSKPLSKADNFPDDKIIKREGRDDVLKMAEAAPAYNGGDAAMRKFLQNNIKYPLKAKDDGVQGTVFVRFVVEKNGVVDDVAVAKGVHPLLDAEAKRVVSVMPKWSAGKQNGKPVAVQYTLPVRFQLVE
jgi:TonB family protein